MNEFDQFVKHELKIKYYIRYADDFVVFSRSKDWLLGQLPKIQDFLKSRLQLNLHPDKVFVKTLASGIDFLGWVSFPSHRVLRTTTKRRMLANLSRNPFPESLASYRGLIKHGNTWKLNRLLDSKF